mmetsp:Transcript_24134/g.57068  ORF Transcript_24134/g.57068 Transcript_24134/m.57068 type:complete len:538 (-) Transcript_24134:166-1779(-)
MAPMATANGAANSAATTTGFRYTPPSYLLKTQAAAQPSATRGGCVGNVRMENRPWVGDENGVDEYDLGMMPQEQRPTKNTTNLDAHFQQRVRAKSNRYRTMLKNGSGSGNGGREDGEDVEGYNVDDIHDEHQQAVLRAEMNVSLEPASTTTRATTTAATVEVPVAPTKVAAAASATQAREARKQRLSGGAGASANSTDPASSSSSSSLRTQKRGSAVGDVVFGGHGIDGGSPKEDVASTARSLRAARLRGSLKPSSDEVDLQSKLEMRRIRSQKEDWQYQQQLQKQQSHSNLQAQRASIEEERRRALEREQREREMREKLEQDRIDAAIEMAHSNRIRSKQIRDASLVAMAKKNKAQRFKASSNGGRRQPSSTSSTSSTDESLDPATKRTAAARTEGKLTRRARLHAMRTGRKTKFPSSSSSSSNLKGAGPSATAHDNAFVDDLAGMLRDSGILSSCVACFGDEDTLDYNKNDSSSSGIVATSPDGSMKLRQRVGYGGGFEDDHVFGNGSSSDDSSAEASARDVQRQKMDLYAKYRE